MWKKGGILKSMSHDRTAMYIQILCFIYQLRKGKIRAFEHYLSNRYLTFYCCYRKYRASDFGNNFLYLVLKY